MPQPHDALSAEELLAHSRWLGRLAASLTADAAAAEDLVQDTWIVALERPPRSRAGLRAWLARVLRNLASDRRRGEGRRERREAGHAARGAGREVPATDELVERLETQRVLAGELQRLEEPYRTTVLLVCCEGLAPSEVARSQGVPAGTVRWRLKRGLERVRARLDERYGGDRRRWTLALAGIARRAEAGEVGTATVATWIGGIVVSRALKLSVGAVVVACLSAVTWRTLAPSLEPAAAEAVPVTELELPAAGEEPELGAASGDAPSERARVAALAPAAAASQEDAREPALAVRFLDELGRPLEGVRVEFPYEATRGLGHALSDAEGRAVMRIDWSLEASAQLAMWEQGLVCVREGRARRRLEVLFSRGNVVDLGDVVLEPECVVLGRVVDSLGRPQANLDVFSSASMQHAIAALVLAEQGGTIPEMIVLRSSKPGAPITTTGADGSFRLGEVPAGFSRVWCGGGERRFAYSRLLELEPGEVARGVELVLEDFAPQDLIEGVVLDPEGLPLPDARVQASYEVRAARGSGSGTMVEETDSEGRFRFALQHQVPHDLRITDRDMTLPLITLAAVAPGTRDLELRFGAPLVVELRVVDEESDRPIEEYTVRARGGDGPDVSLTDHHFIDSGMLGASGTHAGGVARVRLPAERFELDIEARGYAREWLGPFDLGATGERLEIRLRPLPAICGRVLAGGSPVAGAVVELLGLPPADRTVECEDMPCLVVPAPVDRTETDASGRFVAFWEPRVEKEQRWQVPVQEDALRVRASAKRFAATFLEARSLASLADSELEIELTAGGRLAGRVLVGAGRSPAGTIVGITNGDGHPQSARVGPDGAFRFEHLTPGGWLVTQLEEQIAPDALGTSSGKARGPVAFPESCRIVEGEETRYDLDLRGACRVEGRIATEGWDPTGWHVYLQELDVPRREASGASGTVDARGAFACDLAHPARYELELTSRAGVRVTDVVELAAGPNRWSVDLEMASLSAQVADREGKSLLHCLRGDGDLVVVTMLAVDEDGRIAPTRVPAGAATIVRGELYGDPRPYPVLAELDLAPGEARHVEL